jgi:hypothetical protein
VHTTHREQPAQHILRKRLETRFTCMHVIAAECAPHAGKAAAEEVFCSGWR